MILALIFWLVITPSLTTEVFSLPSNRGSAEQEGRGLFSGQRVTSWMSRRGWGLIGGIVMLVRFHDFSFFEGHVQTALPMDDKKKQVRLNRQQTKRG